MTTIFVRPAQPSDISAIAVIRTMCFLLKPHIQAQFGNVTAEEYQSYVAQVAEHDLRNKSKRTWVAIQPLAVGEDPLLKLAGEQRKRRESKFQNLRKQTHVFDGELVGYLCYQRRGLGDVTEVVGCNEPAMPSTTNHTCLVAWQRKKSELLEKWCGGVGKYALGENMGVNPM